MEFLNVLSLPASTRVESPAQTPLSPDRLSASTTADADQGVSFGAVLELLGLGLGGRQGQAVTALLPFDAPDAQETGGGLVSPNQTGITSSDPDAALPNLPGGIPIAFLLNESRTTPRAGTLAQPQGDSVLATNLEASAARERGVGLAIEALRAVLQATGKAPTELTEAARSDLASASTPRPGDASLQGRAVPLQTLVPTASVQIVSVQETPREGPAQAPPAAQQGLPDVLSRAVTPAPMIQSGTTGGHEHADHPALKAGTQSLALNSPALGNQLDGALTEEGGDRHEGSRHKSAEQAALARFALKPHAPGLGVTEHIGRHLEHASSRVNQGTAMSAPLAGQGRAEAAPVLSGQAAPPAAPVLIPPAEPSPASAVQSLRVEVHPADLGPVHLRVVLANQTVHAQVRTGHIDLGQFLVARQGQLETAFNSSGLDMGQFRVLVDRHGSEHAAHGWPGQSQDDPKGQQRQEGPDVKQDMIQDMQQDRQRTEVSSGTSSNPDQLRRINLMA